MAPAHDRIDDVLRRLDRLEETLRQVIARLDKRVDRLEDEMHRLDALHGVAPAESGGGGLDRWAKAVAMFVSVAAGIGVPIALAFALRGGA